LASRQGTYTVYYSEIKGNINIRDSVIITFNKTKTLDVSLSDEILCPGEELMINVRNTQSEPVWNSNLKVNKRLGSAYAVSGLKPGPNLVSFTINDNGACSQTYSKTVNVLSSLNFDYFSTPNVCSGSNATLTVQTSGQKADLYKLNNNIESKTGYFKGLDPGIYVLSVEYEKGCVVRDTILIRDSLNVSPYFIAEKDLLNRNKYSFRNMTNVDDKGYERNAHVSFVWKVNGDVISVEDNPEFEFVTEGHNTVELIAILNDNCQNIYSESIFISGSNFRIPNIFTPNGDGIGDNFVVVFEGELKSYNLEIVNRAGEVVYKSNDIKKSWDGKINGNDDAAEGLYYYIIRGEDKFGNNIEQKGSLRLVRN
jgi:gliding motility-associated-like protein